MVLMMALPQEGYLQHLFHMFAFLENHDNGVMVFELTDTDIYNSCFVKKGWSDAIYV